MRAEQRCDSCGSPLRPCRCEREARKREKPRRGLHGSRTPRKKARAARARPTRAGKRTRRSDDWARKYHSDERRAWVGTLPCCACGRAPRTEPSKNHHTWAEGTGRKGPYWSIVPLCAPCHARYHSAGKLSLLQWVRRRYGALRVGAQEFDQWEPAAAYVERLWRIRSPLARPDDPIYDAPATTYIGPGG